MVRPRRKVKSFSKQMSIEKVFHFLWEGVRPFVGMSLLGVASRAKEKMASSLVETFPKSCKSLILREFHDVFQSRAAAIESLRHHKWLKKLALE